MKTDSMFIGGVVYNYNPQSPLINLCSTGGSERGGGMAVGRGGGAKGGSVKALFFWLQFGPIRFTPAGLCGCVFVSNEVQ